ncbi:ABC transporter ATP-binding protein [Pedobacter sp. Du54]|uniref:ABC transporter ATP-binding protein n=1 Tax=Pedobacter anseongensis TaxID=3133439 RepID=UPI0030A77E48
MQNLILKKINKKYGSNIILAFEQWKINAGVFWLKGGNGTGKTTLFRIIAGQTPFSGQVFLDSIDLKKDPINFRSKISYAEAEPQYPSFITGQELINFYKEVRKAQQPVIDELVTIFEMTEFLDQKIGGYSSGMLKKLSLICAFIGEAELYILDEPLITIDVESAAKLYHLISLKAKQGKSFLLSSHQEIDEKRLKIDGIFQIKNKTISPC